MVRDSSSVWLSSRWERRLLFRTLFLCVMGMDSASTLLGFSLQRKKKDKNTFFFVSNSREIYIFENERHCLVNVQLYLSRKTWISYVSASRLKTAFLPRTDAIRFLIDTWISHQRRKHLLQSGKCRSCVTLRPFQISKLPRISSVSPNTELSQSIKRQV